LFVTEYGGRIRGKDAVKMIWTRTQKLAGVPVLSFHSLRHGFAKAWLTAGGDLSSLQQILGHSDLNVTLPLGNLRSAVKNSLMHQRVTIKCFR
jgi:integrase